MSAASALLGLFTGCTGTRETEGGERTLAAEATQQVLVTTGIRYATSPPGWADARLDLYLPADTHAPPLAVIVPDAGGGASPADYASLARDLAAHGVAAATMAWSVESTTLTTLAGRPVEDLVAQTRQTTAEVSCGVRVAAARAGPGRGAPAAPLVVVGHGAGANAAAMAVLRSTPPFSQCVTDAPAPTVVAAILWDGDWLGGAADDVLGTRTAAFLDAYTPWPGLGRLATSVYVELGVNANRLRGRAVSASPTSSYLTSRDPGGTMTHDLEQVRAFDDGRLDPVDVTRAFAVGLREAGVQTASRSCWVRGTPTPSGRAPGPWSGRASSS